MWRTGKLTAFTQGNALWAMIVGGCSGGGTGWWPSAVVVRSRASRWQLRNRIAIDDRGWKDGFTTRDVNGDGVPEVLGTIGSMGRIDSGGGSDVQHPAAEYVIYKLVTERYRKVWYARVNKPETALTEFGWALFRRKCRREQHKSGATELARALSLVTSPPVLQQARALGLGEGYLEVDEYFSGPTNPYGLVRHRKRHPQPWQWYRLDLTKSSGGIWRISKISRLSGPAD